MGDEPIPDGEYYDTEDRDDNRGSDDNDWENVQEGEPTGSSPYTSNLPHQHECKYWVGLQCLKGHKALGSSQPVTWESGCPSDCPDFEREIPMSP